MIKANEEFREVPSFPDYLISNLGRCKTKSRKITDRSFDDPLLHFATPEESFQFTLKGEEIESLGKQLMEIGQHIQEHGLNRKA